MGQMPIKKKQLIVATFTCCDNVSFSLQSCNLRIVIKFFFLSFFLGGWGVAIKHIAPCCNHASFLW